MYITEGMKSFDTAWQGAAKEWCKKKNHKVNVQTNKWWVKCKLCWWKDESKAKIFVEQNIETVVTPTT